MVAITEPSPPPPASSVTSIKSPTYASCVETGYSHKHTSTPCQDVTVSRIINSVALHAVLDGHGPAGDLVADTAAAALVSAATDRVRKLKFHDPDAHKDLLRAAFVAAAETVDAGHVAAVSGTTASLALFAPPVLTVANVGDSTVVWAKAGRHACVVSANHRVDDIDELERVKRVGGVILNGYLSNGDPWGKAISVTRALGDLDCRPIGVVSEPSVNQIVMEGDKDFVILATDGLWDAHGGVSPQQAVDKVRQCFEEEYSLKFACEELLRMAKRDSEAPGDDFAIVIVKPGVS